MATDPSAYQFVQYSWDDVIADRLDPVGRLVYRSNILGADGRITNTGGGNTSSKVIERDPLSGENVDVLWVSVACNVLAILLMAALGPFPNWGAAASTRDADQDALRAAASAAQ